MKRRLTNNRPWRSTAKYLLLQAAFLLLLGFSAFAQVSIKGKISDEKGSPLSGATVQVKGTGNTTQTDQQGNFTVSAPKASSRLMVSFVGFESKEVAVSSQGNTNITLTPTGGNLGEVVVIGYGTQRKSDLTGAVSSISVKDLQKATPMNTTEAIQGRAAGVLVTTNSGAPGSEGAIRIRGIGTVNNNDPLYVVDGMFVSSINFLNPSDIARIEVLKDASATAIYGSRGANGVVLITTQRGTSGKPVVTFNTNTAISKVSNLPKALNRDQYLDYKKTAYLNGYLRSVANPNPNIDPFTTTEPFFNYIKTVKTEYDKGYNTEWAKELLKTAVVQNYDVAIRGGANNVRYAASAGYFDQKGIIDNSAYKRYTFRLNTDYTLSKRLLVGQNLNITNSITSGRYGESTPGGIINQILNADPFTPVVKPNPDVNDLDYRYNKFARSLVNSAAGSSNPAGIISRMNDRTNLVQLMGNVFAELEIIKGLKLRSSMGIDYSNTSRSAYEPKYMIDALEKNDISTVTEDRANFLGQVWENTLTYNNKFAGHSITGLLGYTEELYKGKFTNAGRQGTANNDPALQVLNAATGSISLSGNKTNFALKSYFARVNYSYADRYLLTATVRRDGSSKFAAGKQWGTFPSASAGWKISSEKFFERLASHVNTLKLRAGWGQIGNQSMPGGTNNPYLSLVEGSNGYRYVFGDAIANGNYLTSLGTPSITWETSEQTNIGLDLGFFKNKLTISADYFIKNTKNMLLQVQLPSYTGFPSIPYTNAGEIQNKGFEITAAYQGNAGKFTYGVSANASRFTNKVLGLGTGNNPIVASDLVSTLSINKTEVGRSVGEFFGYVTDGIFQNMNEVNAYNKNGTNIQPNALPGDFRFKDSNNDGVINAADQTYIGNSLPKLLYGFNLNLGYKNFDIAALFQGAYGNKLFNLNKNYRGTLNGTYNGDLKYYEAAWRGNGTSNTQPLMSTVDRNQNFKVSDWYVEDGSYMRLKNLQIGYNIFQSWLRKAGISSSRIYVGGTDLFTITKYTGIDPEAGLTASPIAAGREFSAYPKMKRYSVGLNLTF
ncbi:MAG: TonB-dependent receptor [Ferruginibacter sp.]